MTLKMLLHSARRALLAATDQRTDRRLGIDAATKHVLQVDPDERNAPYDSLSHQALGQLIARIAPATEDVIYDVGCGKGRMICVFARLDVAACVGVELDPTLADAAQRNIERLASGGGRARIIQGDASDQDYSKATVVVMYNPFGAEVMRAVLKRLTDSLLANPRRVRLYYCGPAQLRVFRDFPAFQPFDAFSLPYDLGRIVVMAFEGGG